MPSGVNVPLTFEIYKVDPKGETLVRKETLTQDIIKVGKLSSSHLRIDDEAVSRMHAVIEIAGPGEIYIIDLGSTKGTLVNGQKVNKCKIQSGDTVVLGNTKIIISVGEPVAAAEENGDGPTQVGQMPTSPPAPMMPARATVMGIQAVSNNPPAPAPRVVAPTPAPAFPPPPASVPAPFAAAATAAPAPGIPAPFAQHAAPAAAASFGPSAGYAPPAGFAPPGFDAGSVEINDGTRAIEVAAMFEESVVEIRHFSNPQSGVITPLTKGLIGGAALSLVIALILFIVNFAQVITIRRNWDAWDAAGKAHNEFPIPHDSPISDILATLLVAFGVGGMLVGLSRLLDERQPRDFTIGPDANTLFAAPGELLPVGTFPLVRSTGTDYELLFTPNMTGDITVDNQSMSLQQLAASGRARPSSSIPGAMAFAIPNGARAKIDLGQNTYLVSSVAPPRHYPTPFTVDWGEQAYTGIVALGTALFLLMIFSMPPDPKSLSLDAFMNDQRFAKFMIKPPEEKEEIPEWLKKKSDDDAGGKGKRHKGDEGKMGKQTSKNKAGLYGLKGPKDNTDPHLAKQLAEEAAKNSGVLGVMKSMEGAHLASIFGRDTALGNDADNVLGGLVGTQIGEANGNGGLGLVGSGKGGGGTGEGTIGLGNLGTIGKGGGGGSGSGYGRGAGGLGGRHAGGPDVVPGQAQVRGSLDKEIIRRIIRRHINEVKFCYEKELMKKPDLVGRITVQFTIAGTGAVVASVVQQSSMNNPSVEQCIAGAVKRWEFPKPQGGGIVIVAYPFVLKAAGGE